MKAVLLALEPNDLEILMIEAQTLDEIYHAKTIYSKVNLGEIWRALEYLLHQLDVKNEQNAPLQFAIEAEYPFTQSALTEVRYNPMTQVEQIAKALESISVEQLKHQFDPEQLKQQKFFPFNWGTQPDKEFLELSMIFTQLQHFYTLAKQHNHAVISLHDKTIQSDIYYMSHAL